MAHGTVNVRLRPIKLAFLVNPNDKDSLLKAIEINTFLWGGISNPIIPTYKRLPSTWEERWLKTRNLNAQKALSGYLDNFDPDYVVPMGECSDYSLDIGDREKVDDVSDILELVEEDGTPRYGIGLFEIFNHFIHRELKFQRRHPLDICIPRFGFRYRIFLASVFGQFSEKIDTIFWGHFAEALEAKKSDCSAFNYTEFFNPQKLFLARMTGLYLEPRHHRERRIFFLDAAKGLDIMDYWNLRAVGWNVIPIPKQFAQSAKTKRPTLEFITANYLTNDSSPKVYHDLTLKSRSISEDEHQLFRDSLATFQSDGAYTEPKLVIPSPYPRMWNEWARDSDGVECCDLDGGTDHHEISTNQETIRFKTLDPKFMNRFGGHGEARFANEIELRLYGDEELFAEIIPEGGRRLATAISFSAFNWRLSRKALVYLSRYSEWTVSLSLPRSEVIFTKWLESKGWTVELSSAGRIANQMMRQLGGRSATGILATKGIIQLLGEMNSSNVILSKLSNQVADLLDLLKQDVFQTMSAEVKAFKKSMKEIQLSAEMNNSNVILSKLLNEISDLQNLLKQVEFQTLNAEVEAFVKYLKEIQPQLGGDEKSMPENSVLPRIARIVNQAKYAGTKERIIQQLIEAKVFQLGLETQCSVCTQSSWYSVKDADYELQCPKCLERLSFPPASKEVTWSYRTLGPFSLPNQAHGAYAVLLTLRFFSESGFLDGATTPLMSFTANNEKMEQMEADLALFFQASKFRESKTEVVFAECKTFNSFRTEDADRMAKLGDAFPGAVLVFAALKESLSEKEKTILCALVNRQRKHRMNGRPFNPVLILTGTELFAELDLSEAWEEAGGLHAAYAKNLGPKDLPELCDITQRIYLGMEPWHQWLDEKSGRITSVQPTTWTTPDGETVRSAN